MTQPLSDTGPLADVTPQLAMLDHRVWDDIRPRGERGGFLSVEFEDPEKMEVGFLYKLYDARQLAGVPFRIIDSVRDDPRSAHGEVPCSAVDLQLLSSWERQRINRACVIVGFVRHGIYPGTDGEYKGQTKRDGGGYHVDASRFRSAACWTRGLRKQA